VGGGLMKGKVTVKWNDTKAIKLMENALTSGIKDACEYILQETNKIAPINEGTLIRSGNIDVESTPKPKGCIYYDTPYAVRLHENPEYSFQNNRKGKYLENTIKDERKTVQDFLKRRLEGVI
jgi:hypothetical protein